MEVCNSDILKAVRIFCSSFYFMSKCWHYLRQMFSVLQWTSAERLHVWQNHFFNQLQTQAENFCVLSFLILSLFSAWRVRIKKKEGVFSFFSFFYCTVMCPCFRGERSQNRTGVCALGDWISIYKSKFSWSSSCACLVSRCTARVARSPHKISEPVQIMWEWLRFQRR